MCRYQPERDDEPFLTLRVEARSPRQLAEAVEVCKRVATLAVQPVSLATVTKMCLEGMRSGWPAPLIAEQVALVARREFALLPQHLASLLNVCADFARAR